MFELMQGKDDEGRDMVMVEMDMVYKMETYNAMRAEMDGMDENKNFTSRQKRKAILGSTYRWPNGRVPYVISSTFSKMSSPYIITLCSNSFQFDAFWMH